MRKDMAQWARECLPCQLLKVSRHNREALERFKEPDNRFEHIHVDLIKLSLVQGMQYCLTMIDRFTCWTMAAPLPEMQTPTVAKALPDLSLRHTTLHYLRPRSTV